VLAQVSGRVSDQVAREAAAKKRPVPTDPERLKHQIAQGIEARNVEQLTDAFAAYCGVPSQTVADLVQEQSDEGMLVLGKASSMAWPELERILRVLLPSRTRNEAGVQALFASYVKLTAANAHRAARFIRASSARMPGESKKSA
jgi:transcriptional regulator of met regulon